jgi:tetratricopeptide (TPR) repeat protein
MSLRVRALFAASLAIFAARAARADPTDDKRAAAKESFHEASAAMARGEYSLAAAAFEQAAAYVPHPQALLNAADAWEHAGDVARAAEDCDRALALPIERERWQAPAAQCAARLSSRVGTLDLRGPPAARVRLDGSPEFAVPARRRVKPGAHEVVVIDLESSRTRTDRVTVGGGETVAVDAGFSRPKDPPPIATGPRDDPPPPTTMRRSRGVPTATWILYAGAAAAAVVGGVFGVETVIAQSDFNAHPDDATKNAFYRYRLVTNVAWAAFGALAAAGTLVWVVAPRGNGVDVAVGVTF